MTRATRLAAKADGVQATTATINRSRIARRISPSRRSIARGAATIARNSRPAKPNRGNRGLTLRDGPSALLRLRVERPRGSDPVKLAIPGDEALHTGLDLGRGLEAYSLLQRIDIGVGLRDVARLRRKHLELRLAAERVLDHRDIVEQSDG